MTGSTGNGTDPRKTLGPRVLKALAQRGLQATPRNYEIWYVALDGHAELKAELDALGEGPLDEFKIDSIARRVLGDPASILTGVAQRIRDEAGKVLDSLGDVRTDASSFRESLERFLSELSSVDAPDAMDAAAGLRDSVTDIVRRTEDMETRSTRWSGDLEDARGEIAELRGRLDRMTREAQTDSLTGIGNRRVFDAAIRETVTDLATGTLSDAALLLLDIDRFKAFNDTHGHLLGDQVLKVVAALIRELTDDTDTVARYGGEEFGVVVRGRSREAAMDFAERIRERVATKRIVIRATGQNLGSVTMSIGVASITPSESPEQAVARADKALYAAKSAGRNRVVVAGDAG